MVVSVELLFTRSETRRDTYVFHIKKKKKYKRVGFVDYILYFVIHESQYFYYTYLK